MAMKTNFDLATMDRAKANATIRSQAVESGADRLPSDAGGSQATAPQGAPPSLTGGERVPDGANGTSTCGGKVFPSPLVEKLLLMVNGKSKRLLARHGVSGDVGFIDWLNFTVEASSFEWDAASCDLSEEKLILDASLTLEGIFGFGITGQLPAGRNFYQRAYALGETFGFLAIGGQRGTVMVSVSGQGLAAALDGWEHRLVRWLEHKAQRPRLTRVDVAHECYAGEYTVDQAFDDYKAGGAGTDGRMPVCEHRGDWHRPNGSGRTFYIGKRASGKFVRVYEKGKQLGDVDSEWVRVECEFKSVDRILPFDILLNAGAYLAGAYPMLQWISAKQTRILTVKKSVEATYKSTCVWLKRQCGGALHFVEQIEGSAQAVLDLVRRDKGIPARFKAAAPSLEDAGISVQRQLKVALPFGLKVAQMIAAA